MAERANPGPNIPKIVNCFGCSPSRVYQFMSNSQLPFFSHTIKAHYMNWELITDIDLEATRYNFTRRLPCTALLYMDPYVLFSPASRGGYGNIPGKVHFSVSRYGNDGNYSKSIVIHATTLFGILLLFLAVSSFLSPLGRQTSQHCRPLLKILQFRGLNCIGW
jgi:hypothetical protein